MSEHPGLVLIETPDDERVAAYCQVRERDLVGRDLCFIVEGRVPLAVLIERSRHPVESVLIAAHRVDSQQDILSRLAPSVPVYAAAQPVMDAITGFHIHRGILAVARRAPDLSLPALLAEADPRKPLLALVEISNHDNVGACLRNAAALGAAGVILDRHSADPFYRKAIRVSAGAALWLPMAFAQNWEEILDSQASNTRPIFALSPKPPALDIRTAAIPANAILVLGAEGPGLPEALLRRVNGLRIPMADGVDSLNVATAGAIALSHISAAPEG